MEYSRMCETGVKILFYTQKIFTNDKKKQSGFFRKTHDHSWISALFESSFHHGSIIQYIELTDQNPVILAAVINPGREIHFGKFVKKPSGIRRISECTDLHTVGYRWRRIRKFGICIFIRRIHVGRV